MWHREYIGSPSGYAHTVCVGVGSVLAVCGSAVAVMKLAALASATPEKTAVFIGHGAAYVATGGRSSMSWLTVSWLWERCGEILEEDFRVDRI